MYHRHASVQSLIERKSDTDRPELSISCELEHDVVDREEEALEIVELSWGDLEKSRGVVNDAPCRRLVSPERSYGRPR